MKKTTKFFTYMGTLIGVSSPIALSISCGDDQAKKGIIIISIPNTATSVNAMMGKLAQEEANKYGYSGRIVETNEDAQMESTKIRTIIDSGQKVIGIVSAPAKTEGSKAILKYAISKGIKVATMDRIIGRDNNGNIIPSGQIYTNDADVASNLVEKAVSWWKEIHPSKNSKEELSKLHIAVLSGDSSSSTATGRLEGLSDAILQQFYGKNKNESKKLRNKEGYVLGDQNSDGGIAGVLWTNYADKWAADQTITNFKPIYNSQKGGFDLAFTASTPQSQATANVVGSKATKIFAFDAEHKLDNLFSTEKIIAAGMQRFDLFTKWAVAKVIREYENEPKNKIEEKTKLNDVKASNFNGGTSIPLNKKDVPVGATWITKENMNEMLF